MADSDWQRLKAAWTDRDHWGLASIVAANLVAVAALAGIVLLALLVGIHALDWLGVLPCLCV